MVNLKELENIIMMMVIISLENIKMEQEMGKEFFIIRMEIYNTKVNISIIILKEMENVFGKMVNIILDNGKII